ncbi:MAG: FlgB family protein [Paracoccaceae bacterium]|nr:FlgB family protein [Paracoccaceae bacterium]
MFEKLEIMQIAQAMASHAALRQSAVTQNIANADTPGYKAKDVSSFAETYETEDRSPLRATRAGHIGARDSFAARVTEQTDTAATSPNGNSVSLEDEMVKGADIKRQHDLALTIYKTSLGILRTSLGRS